MKLQRHNTDAPKLARHLCQRSIYDVWECALCTVSESPASLALTGFCSSFFLTTFYKLCDVCSFFSLPGFTQIYKELNHVRRLKRPLQFASFHGPANLSISLIRTLTTLGSKHTFNKKAES